MATRRRLKGRVRRAAAFREAVSARVFAMEEPLRHAAQFVRTVQIAHRPEDDEMEALSFVAGEAWLLLEAVQEELRGLFRVIERSG